jgi:SAM-dependent methyltransferase
MSEAVAAEAGTAAAYLDTAFTPKGVGGWRKVYLAIIDALGPHCVLEAGAGAPDFMLQVHAPKRIAVDVGAKYKAAFQQAGVEFAERDLDRDTLAGLGPVDVAVCSDVFEHLVHPARALAALCDVLRPQGVLLSHVPNEYRLAPTLGVMFGRREATQFHQGAREWDDPHVRRFTDRGFRAFLESRFAHNLALTPLRYGRPARLFKALGLSPPYCLQGGPTYASTNDAAAAERLKAIARSLARS